jgi:hypothetical protein
LVHVRLRLKIAYNLGVPKKSNPAPRQFKVGDHLLVKLTAGRIVEATVKAVIETTNGVRLQVSFGDETARIYEWQIVKEAR